MASTLKERKMKKYAIGIDLGATFFRVGLIDNNGKVLSLEKSSAPKDSKIAIKNIKRAIKNIINRKGLNFQKEISGIGLSIASPVNPQTGQVNWSKKLPFSGNYNILKDLKKGFRKPIFIENDLNAAALAELHFGSLKGKKNGIILTVSSGIGSGIILNGSLYRGSNFSAGEVGHIVVNPLSKELFCNRGDTGCWEAFASAKSVERRYFLKYKKRKTAKEIVALAKKGDKKSLKILKEAAFWLGIGMSNVINILDPEVIIIYGSFFLESWPLMKNDILKVIKKRSFNPKIKILKTRLGDNGCLLGAGLLVFKS